MKNQKQSRFILWAPRVLGIMMVLFLALFSLDVFELASSPMDLIKGLLVHNIPSFLLILVLVICWHREWLGAILFPLLGVAYSLSNLSMHWSVYVVIAGPLFLIGLLFLLSWNMKRRQILTH
jgi:hypothetical protein